MNLQERTKELRDSIVFLKRYSDKEVLSFSIRSALNNLKFDGEKSKELISMFDRGDLDALTQEIDGIEWLIKDIELYKKTL